MRRLCRKAVHRADIGVQATPQSEGVIEEAAAIASSASLSTSPQKRSASAAKKARPWESKYGCQGRRGGAETMADPAAAPPQAQCLISTSAQSALVPGSPQHREPAPASTTWPGPLAREPSGLGPGNQVRGVSMMTWGRSGVPCAPGPVRGFFRTWGRPMSAWARAGEFVAVAGILTAGPQTTPCFRYRNKAFCCSALRIYAA